MKRILFLIVLGGILLACRANECNAAELGDCITVGGVNYEVTDNKTKLTVAVIGFKMNEDQENNEKIFIPESIIYDGEEYAVDELKFKYNSMSLVNTSELDIPKSITKSNVKWISIEGGKADITFRCPADALKEIDSVEVNAPAIESIIYVPEEYIKDYKNIFDGKTQCVFYDNDIAPRSYTGIPIYAVGTQDPLPEGFCYKDSYYRILDSKKKTVSLICSYALNKEGINGTCYKQPSKVYYNGIKYKVTKIEYYAFCNVRVGEVVELKLPKTISSIESKSIGWTVRKLDLSETKIKKIPAYVINSKYDNYDEPAILDEVVLPTTCKKLIKHAFYNLKKLKNITLYENTSIGYHALPKKCKVVYSTVFE